MFGKRKRREQPSSHTTNDAQPTFVDLPEDMSDRAKQSFDTSYITPDAQEEAPIQDHDNNEMIQAAHDEEDVSAPEVSESEELTSDDVQDQVEDIPDTTEAESEEQETVSQDCVKDEPESSEGEDLLTEEVSESIKEPLDSVEPDSKGYTQDQEEEPEEIHHITEQDEKHFEDQGEKVDNNEPSDDISADSEAFQQGVSAPQPLANTHVSSAPSQVSQGARHGKAPEKKSRKQREEELPSPLRKSHRTRRALLVALVLLVILLGVLVYLGFKLVSASQEAAQYVITQTDTTEVKEGTSVTHDASGDNQKVAQIPALSEVIGLQRDDAITALGHGATLTLASDVSSDGVAVIEKDTVMLTADPVDKKAGAPTVYLGIDSNGAVAQAGYTVATASLGAGSLSFSDAITTAHIVERSVSEAGVPVADGSVSLPSKTEYSTYASDGETLLNEKYTFTGSGTSAQGSTLNWSVVLSYDYSASNASGNLSDAVRLITVYLTDPTLMEGESEETSE